MMMMMIWMERQGMSKSHSGVWNMFWCVVVCRKNKDFFMHEIMVTESDYNSFLIKNNILGVPGWLS